jgi:hypothetical protein
MNSKKIESVDVDFAALEKAAGCFLEIHSAASKLLSVLDVIDADNPPTPSETAALVELMGLQIRRMAWINCLAANKIAPGLMDAASLDIWFDEPGPCKWLDEPTGH